MTRKQFQKDIYENCGKLMEFNCFIFMIKELMPVTECQLFQFIMIKELMPHD